MFKKLISYLFKDFYFFTAAYSNQVFPDPLSKEEEEKYLERMKLGDKEARNILIEHNLRLVAHIVKKYEHSKEDSDDLISIGTIGLIKGIDSYSYKHGTRITTYCARCIENEILMLFRNNKKQKNEVYLQEPIGVDKEGNEICLIDVLSSERDSVIDKVESKLEIKSLYRKMKEVLTKREYNIIIMRYGLDDGRNRTQREIAGLLNISRSYVSRIEKKALKKLKKSLTYNS